MCTPERPTSRAKTSRIHVICAQYCSNVWCIHLWAHRLPSKSSSPNIDTKYPNRVCARVCTPERTTSRAKPPRVDVIYARCCCDGCCAHQWAHQYVCMYVCMYGHTYSKSVDEPGKAASLARGQLNRKNEYFPVRVRAWEFGLARRVRQSCPASACSSPYSGWIWCLLTGFPSSSAAASIHTFITALRHRVSLEFIGLRNCVPMAFTAESPPARGQ